MTFLPRPHGYAMKWWNANSNAFYENALLNQYKWYISNKKKFTEHKTETKKRLTFKT